MEIAGQAKISLTEHPNARIFIDVEGVGAGVYDRLKEQPEVSAACTT